MSARQPRILVIKHGAFGDIIQALGAFQAIRRQHAAAHLTLLTTPPFRDLAAATGLFDDIWLDERLPAWRLDAVLKLRRRLRQAGFQRVYDLQNSQRSSFYFRLFGRRCRPQWSGIAGGASHRYDHPERKRLHAGDRLARQLAVAGIAAVPPPDLGFLNSDITRRQPGLDGRLLLLVPGSSSHRPEKRWPPGRYAELGRRASSRGLTPVLLGSAAEAELLAGIAAAVAGAIDLAGRTSFADLAELARHAVAAVGNDTGPMQLIAAAGCRSLVLFSGASDPALSAPRGRCVATLQREPLEDLPEAEVAAALGL